jgi:hypothetical protein
VQTHFFSRVAANKDSERLPFSDFMQLAATYVVWRDLPKGNAHQDPSGFQKGKS